MTQNTELTHEHLTEALMETKGFILSAQKYLKKKYGYRPDTGTIKKRIEEWGMHEWLEDIRKSLVEDCLQKTFHKGIAQGDNHCIFWVLEKYGHHVDFLGGKDTETESKKGWRELLAYVKRDIESDPETLSDREHG